LAQYSSSIGRICVASASTELAGVAAAAPLQFAAHAKASTSLNKFIGAQN